MRLSGSREWLKHGRPGDEKREKVVGAFRTALNTRLQNLHTNLEEAQGSQTKVNLELKATSRSSVKESHLASA